MVFDTTHISQIFSTLLYNLVYVKAFIIAIGRTHPGQKRYEVVKSSVVDWHCRPELV
jgi:hypothetical protein